MIDTLIKTTILLALVACAAHLLRRRSAALRHLLWALAIAGLVALPVFATVVPFRLAILPSRAAESTVVSSVSSHPRRTEEASESSPVDITTSPAPVGDAATT